MILPLRQRHRRIFAVLGILLPLAFIAGIAARKPMRSTSTLPSELRNPAQTFTNTNWSRADLFAKTHLRVRMLQEPASRPRYAIAFSDTKAFLNPDLIVYWVVGNPVIRGAIPDNAVLLGTFSSPALTLPDEATQAKGVLVLYSLADKVVVDVSQAVGFGPSFR